MNLFIEILRSALPVAIPILLAALGGLFTWHVNVFNISMEGMLLASAFSSVAGSYAFESWGMGVAFGIGGSLFISLLFAFFVLKMHTGEFITGIAINTFVLGATTYFLRQLFKVKGSLINPKIQSLPRWDIPFVKDIPILGSIINGHAFPLYIAFLVIVPLVFITIYKTPFGLHLRAAGFDFKVIDSVGIKANRLKFIAILVCGLLCGIGGNFLSLGYMRMFTENMSNGRGWISLAAIILTKGNPLKILITCLVFGVLEGLGLAFQVYKIPNQITDMLPYFAVLAALFFYSSRSKKKTNRVSP
jgi:simple sugar transport system permease protein